MWAIFRAALATVQQQFDSNFPRSRTACRFEPLETRRLLSPIVIVLAGSNAVREGPRGPVLSYGTFTINWDNPEGDEPLTVPLVFSGTAIPGAAPGGDYTAPASVTIPLPDPSAGIYSSVTIDV